MRKNLIASYIAGIKDRTTGEAYSKIIRYFLPEFVTALALYSFPLWLDALFIGTLKSTPMYATLGATNNLLHLLIKIAEAFSIGTVVLAGNYNGMHEYKKVGSVIKDAFWLSCFFGACIALFLYGGAYHIYVWYGVPHEIINLGIPFLRLRAIAMFFTFIYLALVAFLRSIKNTRGAMYIFISGALVFVLFDYMLIFGAFGMPKLGLNGSAIATIIQSIIMIIVSCIYIFTSPRYKPYGIDLLSSITDFSYVRELLRLSWPVVLDKAALAIAYIWLCKMIAPMGTCALATFSVVKDLERFAFLPAIAFAQVITILVSNDYGAGHWTTIKTNIKKTVFLASIMVFSILLFFIIFSHKILPLFDKQGDFTPMAVRVFPILSVLVFFDLLQLILSGALRGAGNVKIVMVVRLLICVGYFVPVSYVLSLLPLEDMTLKFILIYGSFYIGNALMSVVYIGRFRGQQWKSKTI